MPGGIPRDRAIEVVWTETKSSVPNALMTAALAVTAPAFAQGPAPRFDIPAQDARAAEFALQVADFELEQARALQLGGEGVIGVAVAAEATTEGTAPASVEQCVMVPGHLRTHTERSSRAR